MNEVNPQKIANILKDLRTSHNLSIEELSKKSLVSFNFIKNLENNQLNKLPSFVFSIGLFTNLLEFFKLSQEKIKTYLELFEKEFYVASKEEKIIISDNQKNQTSEEKTPVKIKWNNIYFVISLLIVLVIILSFFLWNNLYSSNELLITKGNQKIQSSIIYSLYENRDTFDLKKSDKVKIFFREKIVEYELIDIVENKFLTFRSSSQGELKVSLYQETYLNLDENTKEDLGIKFQKQSGDIAIVTFSLLNENAKEIDFKTTWNNVEKINLNNNKEEVVIIQNHYKVPIRIFIKTTYLPVHLSYNIDGQKQNQINLSPYEEFSLSAENHLIFQIGNYKSVQLIVNQIPINFKTEDNNRFGVTKIIKWVPNVLNETKFNLIIKGN